MPTQAVVNCTTLAYCPAPGGNALMGFRPEQDFESVEAFKAETICRQDQCAELFRVHRMIRSIMATNRNEEGHPVPIPVTSVMGFPNALILDDYLYEHPTEVQVFSRRFFVLDQDI
jgi:hypothetical protein